MNQKLESCYQWLDLRGKCGTGFIRNFGAGGKLSGFTMVEMLIVIVLMSTVGLVLVAVFMRSLRTSGRNVIMERLENEGELVMGRIIGWAREAKSVGLQGVSCNDAAVVPCSGDCTLVMQTQSRKEVEIRCDMAGEVVREFVDGEPSDLTSGGVRVIGCEFDCSKVDYFKPGVLKIELTVAVGRGEEGERAEERVETTLRQSVVLGNF